MPPQVASNDGCHLKTCLKRASKQTKEGAGPEAADASPSRTFTSAAWLPWPLHALLALHSTHRHPPANIWLLQVPVGATMRQLLWGQRAVRTFFTARLWMGGMMTKPRSDSVLVGACCCGSASFGSVRTRHVSNLEGHAAGRHLKRAHLLLSLHRPQALGLAGRSCGPAPDISLT